MISNSDRHLPLNSDSKSSIQRELQSASHRSQFPSMCAKYLAAKIKGHVGWK
jgi:hypothetical protein